MFLEKRLEDGAIVNFFRRLHPGDRFNVEWISTTELLRESSHRPVTTIWKGTYLRQSDNEGEFDVNYDNERSINRTMPTDHDIVVIRLEPLHDAGLIPAASSRIPPHVISSRPHVAFNPEVVIFFDGGYDRETKICNSAVVAKVYLSGDRLPKIFTFSFFFTGGTNNVAEHLGMLGALRLAKLLARGGVLHADPLRSSAVVGDSELTVKQNKRLSPARPGFDPRHRKTFSGTVAVPKSLWSWVPGV